MKGISQAHFASLSTPTSTTVNSLRPTDAIRRQGTKSTLAHVMACCLKAPSHYLSQCWLIIIRSCGIHRRALWWEDLKIPISKTRLKITFLEPHSDLPGANDNASCYDNDTLSKRLHASILDRYVFILSYSIVSKHAFDMKTNLIPDLILCHWIDLACAG